MQRITIECNTGIKEQYKSIHEHCLSIFVAITESTPDKIIALYFKILITKILNFSLAEVTSFQFIFTKYTCQWLIYFETKLKDILEMLKILIWRLLHLLKEILTKWCVQQESINWFIIVVEYCNRNYCVLWWMWVGFYQICNQSY